MHEQGDAQYDACRERLDRLYAEIEAARAEFRELVSRMAAAIAAEKAG